MKLLPHQRVYLKNEDRTHSIKELSLMGDKIEITFNSGKRFKYHSYNVEIKDSILSDKKYEKVYDYLSALASCTGVTIDTGYGKKLNILEGHYKKISFIGEESILGSYICEKLPPAEDRKRESAVIYPFGFNFSQKEAVEKAVKNRISAIQGPPGTGKTQTILNILANLIIEGKSVAVVSNNNAALENVYEKLERNKLDFMSAFLGSNARKEDFIENQKKRESLVDWRLEQEEFKQLHKDIKSKEETLNKRLSQKIELSALKQEQSSVETESNYFFNSLNEEVSLENRVHIGKLTHSESALNSWFYIEASSSESIFHLVFFSLATLFSPKLRYKLTAQQGLRSYSRVRLIELYQYRFYELRLKEINEKVRFLEKELNDYDFELKMDEYTQDSFDIFRDAISKRYSVLNDKKFDLVDLSRNPWEFLHHYPIILSTAYSLKTSLNKDVEFDYVIVDESSQVDICTGALVMSCAKNIVVVGDLMQLHHVVDKKMAKKTDSLFIEGGFPKRLSYKDQSLLSSLIETFPKMDKTLLREHYRCHPKIIDFCNKKFYRNQLIVMSKAKSERDPLVVYKTVKGNHARARKNQRQIDVIVNEIIPEEKLCLEDGSVGLISPYRNQTNELQKVFSKHNVKADTVDKFQGQERKIVILSTVDNKISEFSDNANRLNVAISRAVEQLIVVVNDTKSIEDTNLGDLINYIEYNNLKVSQSEIRSVFDYLYGCYTKKRHEFLAKGKKVSIYPSENAMNILLLDILKENRFSSLGHSTHVPLRMILGDLSRLSEEERVYALNYLTHVDFLVFDKISKSPCLVIEVDGTSFHKEGTRQAVRDKMKDQILEKFEIPFIRCRTDESNERDRIIAKL